MHVPHEVAQTRSLCTLHTWDQVHKTRSFHRHHVKTAGYAPERTHHDYVNTVLGQWKQPSEWKQSFGKLSKKDHTWEREQKLINSQRPWTCQTGAAAVQRHLQGNSKAWPQAQHWQEGPLFEFKKRQSFERSAYVQIAMCMTHIIHIICTEHTVHFTSSACYVVFHHRQNPSSPRFFACECKMADSNQQHTVSPWFLELIVVLQSRCELLGYFAGDGPQENKNKCLQPASPGENQVKNKKNLCTTMQMVSNYMDPVMSTRNLHLKLR